MNYINEKLYSTTMKFNPKQEILHFYDIIKSTQKINKLDEIYNKVNFSNLDDKTVVMLQEIIEWKVENIKLKGHDQAS
jgi:hypothetical protein